MGNPNKIKKLLEVHKKLHFYFAQEDKIIESIEKDADQSFENKRQRKDLKTPRKENYKIRIK